jgi:NAD(P)-dependent dehydrogenase (short-subunit alcohol dehydrogenase family)
VIFSPTLLAGRTILVTGASSGIGKYTATDLAQAGAKLLLLGRNEERLNQTKAALIGDGHCIFAKAFEDQDEIADRIQQIAIEQGGVDGIFHAAGIGLVRPVRMTKAKQVQEVFASSFFAAMAIARAASMKDVMREHGALVFMSSVAGTRGQTGMVAYSAAKSAIEGMVRSLACELAPRHIRVNAIASGAVATEMHERLTVALTDEARGAYESKHLLGFGTPNDVAGVATFLLSDAARWITGATWVVDGGYSVR